MRTLRDMLAEARKVVPEQGEIGRLAQAFNRMAEDLVKHEKNLVEQERMRRELELCRETQEELLPSGVFRAGLVEATITGEQRSWQVCDHRTDDQCCNPLVTSSCLVQLSLLQFVNSVSSLIERAGTCVPPSPKEQSAQFLPSQHPPQLLDREERDKRRDHNQPVGEYFIPTLTDQIMKSARHAFPSHKPAYHMFDNLESNHPNGEYDRLMQCRNDQGFIFMLPASTCGLAN